MRRPVQSTPWLFPERPWSRLHVDFGGPFKGHYFLVIVDAYSKWVEVIPVTSPSSDATISCLRAVFATHGIPDIIVSDNGTAFTSATFQQFLQRNQIRGIRVPPYHPASNGAAERIVQLAKNKLKKSTSGDFQTQIHRMLFQYRTTPHSLTGRTPAELLMGRTLRIPLKALCPDHRGDVVLKQLKQKLHQDKGARRDQLPQPGSHVLVKNFRPGPSWLPATVIRLTSSSSVQVELADGSSSDRRGDHLRPDDRSHPPYSSSPSSMPPTQPSPDTQTEQVNSEGSPTNVEAAPVPNCTNFT